MLCFWMFKNKLPLQCVNKSSTHSKLRDVWKECINYNIFDLYLNASHLENTRIMCCLVIFLHCVRHKYWLTSAVQHVYVIMSFV